MIKIDDVISKILFDLDKEQAEYQRIFRKLYGISDTNAKQTYQLLIDLCERIKKELK